MTGDISGYTRIGYLLRFARANSGKFTPLACQCHPNDTNGYKNGCVATGNFNTEQRRYATAAVTAGALAADGS